MSRNIKNDHPWTEDEVQYILARSGGQDLVDRNRAEYPPGSEPDVSPDDEDLDLSQEVYDFVKDLSIEALQTELTKNKLSPKGEEVEMRIRLAQHLQAQKNKKAEGGSHS